MDEDQTAPEWGTPEFFNELRDDGDGDSVYAYYSYGSDGFQKARHGLLLDFLAKHSEHLAGKSVLDAGCAEGSFTAKLGERLNPVRLVGADFADELIADAEKKFTDSADFIVAGFPDSQIGERFDSIVCLEMIYYLDNDQRRALMVEFARLLVDGGSVFLASNLQGGKFCTEEQLMEYAGDAFSVVDRVKLHLRAPRRLARLFHLAHRIYSERDLAFLKNRGALWNFARSVLKSSVIRPFWGLISWIGGGVLQWEWPYRVCDRFAFGKASHLVLKLKKS